MCTSTDEWKKDEDTNDTPKHIQDVIKLVSQISDEINSVSGVGITGEPSEKQSWVYNSCFHTNEF